MMVGVILETIGVQWVDILDMIAAVAAGSAHVNNIGTFPLGLGM